MADSVPPSAVNTFSAEEITALKGIFQLHDPHNTGKITLAELENVLQRIGKGEGDRNRLLAAASDVADGPGDDATVTLQQFLELLAATVPQGNVGGPDAKVIEFLRILEEYRLKCVEEGNYLEASRAHRQLETLKKQEQRRQEKAIRARQIAERQDVQVAHNIQYTDFNAAWDAYMEEYDRMAQMYIQQMTEKHAMAILEFQKELQKQVDSRPPKWSRELLEWRRRQHILARQKSYAEAQRVKQIADRLEDKERKANQNRHAAAFARKEAGFRQHQQAELHALLKRIDARRKEHAKQRNLDSKRLLQRNRNVQAVLESKQAVETTKLFSDVKKALQTATTTLTQAPRDQIPPARIPGKKKMRLRRKKPQEEGIETSRQETSENRADAQPAL